MLSLINISLTIFPLRFRLKIFYCRSELSAMFNLFQLFPDILEPSPLQFYFRPFSLVLSIFNLIFWTFFIYISFLWCFRSFFLVFSIFLSGIFDLNIIGYWCGVDHYVIFQYWVVGVTVGWLHIQETHILFLFFHILFSHFFI